MEEKPRVFPEDGMDEIPEEKIAERRAVPGISRAKRQSKPVVETELTRSLDALESTDFAVQPKKKKNRRGLSVTQWVILALCLGVFLYSGYRVALNLFDYAEGQKQYNELWGIFYAQASGEDYLAPDGGEPVTPNLLSAMESSGEEEGGAVSSGLLGGLSGEEDYQVIIARLQKLKSLNPDTYGWIRVTGTSIDYPVVKASDNDFYLRRGFYKTYLNSGTIFADAACLTPGENRNTVLYGHNMKDGTMFHTLHNLKTQSYFEGAQVQLMTTEGIYVYDVYSVHVPHETDAFFHTQFTENTWLDFLDWTKNDSMYVRQDVSLTPNDKVITLSTCTTTSTEEPYRLAVHAKLVEVITA